MTLDEITGIDKELLAARYEAAISKEFGAQETGSPTVPSLTSIALGH